MGYNLMIRRNGYNNSGAHYMYAYCFMDDKEIPNIFIVLWADKLGSIAQYELDYEGLKKLDLPSLEADYYLGEHIIQENAIKILDGIGKSYNSVRVVDAIELTKEYKLKTCTIEAIESDRCKIILDKKRREEDEKRLVEIRRLRSILGPEYDKYTFTDELLKEAIRREKAIQREQIEAKKLMHKYFIQIYGEIFGSLSDLAHKYNFDTRNIKELFAVETYDTEVALAIARSKKYLSIKFKGLDYRGLAIYTPTRDLNLPGGKISAGKEYIALDIIRAFEPKMADKYLKTVGFGYNPVKNNNENQEITTKSSYRYDSLTVFGIEINQLNSDKVMGIEFDTIKNRMSGKWDTEVSVVIPPADGIRTRIKFIGLNGKSYYKVKWSEVLVTARQIVEYYRPDLLDAYDKSNPTGEYRPYIRG